MVLLQWDYTSVIANSKYNPAKTTGMRLLIVNLKSRKQIQMEPVGCLGSNRKHYTTIPNICSTQIPYQQHYMPS